MNYLAHFYLCPDNEDILLGGILGDFVKGPIKDDGTLLHRSIMLHRKLDTFTDTNPIIKKSKSLININQRRYAGVIVDMFYDHFLSKNWEYFHSKPLDIYAQNIYRILQKRSNELPKQLQLIAPKMTAEDWLCSYKDLNYLKLVLRKIGQRFKKTVRLDHAMIDLTNQYDAMENNFFTFMPLAIKFCEEFSDSHFKGYNSSSLN